MEVAIVGGIIATITGELATSRIIKESSLLSRVKEDLVWIETEMRRIRSFIRDIWDLAYDVEDIIDTYFPKIRLSRSQWKRLLA
ncbi:hypothetical protein RHGRI_014677 [Rhododendron griersonianum]|uniref:Uncharacterized protein n=1 Tax=Rhododendron griersonianum TaxID=479676 RepID=A0AAV6KAA9_9ERIC|nr:hypothetical protein RHGRI_014677 [Rhododendron griersonianum]